MTESTKSRIFYGIVILSLILHIASIEEKLERARYAEGFLRSDIASLRERLLSIPKISLGNDD